MFAPRSYSLAIVAAGTIADYASLRQELRRYARVIAVDAGVHHCLAMDVTPHVLIGDFDSVDPELLQSLAHLPQHRFPQDKDHSDLELALALPEAGSAADVTVFAAMGGRTDHLISNLSLLAQRPGSLMFETETEYIACLPREIRLALRKGQRLSLMPLFGPVERVSSTGLKWELSQRTLDQTHVSLSNVATADEVVIKHGAGALICIIEK